MPVIRCLPSNVVGPCQDPLRIDANGKSLHPSITDRVSGNLARGDLEQINGIIIHQTGGSTAASTLNSYAIANANGAHFLIAKDGKIYQTASVFKKTWHVGKLRSRCVAQGTCSPVNAQRDTSAKEIEHINGLGPTARNNYEKSKDYPDRYPMNADSLGIEIVGTTIGNDPNNPGELLYENVNAAQNASLVWLVKQLSIQFGVGFSSVFRHPLVSAKTPSEAATANWIGN